MKLFAIFPDKKPKKVVNVNIGYAYTTFLAFLMNLRYNNRRKISISNLKEFRPVFFKKFVENSDRNLISKEKLVINSVDDFDSFLAEYGNYFKVARNDLILDDCVSCEDIEKILESLNIPQYKEGISTINYDRELKDILGLDGIQNILVNYLKLETKLEEYYVKFQNGDFECLSKIKELLYERNLFYYNVLMKGPDFLEDCGTEASDLIESAPNPYKDFYPIDRKYYIEQGTDFTTIDSSVDEIICDSYFFAIFTNIPLDICRIYEDVQNLRFHHFLVLPSLVPESNYESRLRDDIKENALKKGNFLYTIRRPEEEYFFLTYIKKLDELQKKYGDNEELNIAKTRLLYLLDNLTVNLLENDNFEVHYEMVKLELDEDEDFVWWYDLVEAVIPEIFEYPDDENLRLKKIILVATYYSLTEDPEIDRILEQYKSHPKYGEYVSYIKGRNLSLVLND